MTSGRIELTTSDGSVLLFELISRDAWPLAELISSNRDHLSRWYDETDSEYPDFEEVLRSIISPANPNKTRFGIWYEGVLAGIVNITPMKATWTSEIGYWVGREFCGKGLATVAVKAIIQYCKCLVYTDRMIANTHLDNPASQKVLLNAGMIEFRRDDTYVWFAINTES